MNLFHRLLHGCEEASFLALRRREEKLPLPKRLQVSIHLFLCSCCTQFVKQSKQMDKALRHFSRELSAHPPPADESFKARLKERLK